MSSKPRPTVYMSNGEVLSTPPLTIRVARFFENVYMFLGLYVVSFFSLDPMTAAQNSQFNVSRSGNKTNTRSRWGGSSGGGGGGSGGGGPGGGSGGSGGFGPRRIGRVDDVRGPECGSCR